LNNTLPSRKATETAAIEAAEKALREEIAANSDLKREEGLRSMHQLLENASPPWQIERLGEDLATVSMTTCPLDSESGQIISRSGKNVNFSRNGNSENEFMIFRSEHGISVNHLINFRRCLKAVSRRLPVDGRINDICLDRSWNIASPIPIEEEEERLRLYFSLAIHFEVLKREANAYVFVGQSGRQFELHRHHDVTRTVKRFEAFEKLYELDCEGNAACKEFIAVMEGEVKRRKAPASIEGFKTGLHTYQNSLRQLAREANDPRDQRQLEKEDKGIDQLIDQIDRFLKETRRDEDGN
jgi:hypothetical protein